MGSKGEPDTRPSHPRRLTGGALRAWALKEPVQALTAGGLLLYASIRVDYFFFYGPFGIKPEDVGLGYGTTLAQTLVGAVLVTVFVSVVVLVYVVVFAYLAPLFVHGVRGLKDLIARRGWRFALVACGLTFAALFLGSYLASLLIPGIISWETRAPQRVIVALLNAPMVIGLGNAVEQAIEWGWGLRKIVGRNSRVPLILLSATILSALFVLLPYFARQDANAVIRGIARESQTAGFLQLPWGADIAHVEWVGQTPPEANLYPADCLMYLGRSSGTVFLFDATRKETILVPESQVVLVIRRDELECEGAPTANSDA